jgi:hypothetical protein
MDNLAIDILIFETAVENQRACVTRYERRLADVTEELRIQRGLLKNDEAALQRLRDKLLEQVR